MVSPRCVRSISNLRPNNDRVRDGNLLEIDITLDDPVAYAQPLHGTFFFKKDPTIEFTEWNCDGMFDYRPHQPGAKTN